MKVADLFLALRNHLDAMQEDANKADNGNKAAGTRLRQGMQEVKQMAQNVREAVIEQRQGK